MASGTNPWELKEIKVSPKKNKIAWVFPTTGAKPELVNAQLEAWKRQTLSSDIIIVATDTKLLLPLLKSATGPINLLERMEDTGAAGGFFSGERWAFHRGYEKIMISDDDAVLLTDDGIELLAKALDEQNLQTAQAKHHFYGEAKYNIQNFPAGNVAMCTMFKRDVFERIGFSYAPYYMFWEDIEFGERIARERLPCLIVDAALFDHPRPKIRPIPSLYYLVRNQLCYYLYQKKNLLRFLNAILLGHALRTGFRKTNQAQSELMGKAIADGLRGDLGRRELAWEYPPESSEFKMDKPIADLDSASSKSVKEIERQLNARFGDARIRIFSKNPMQRILGTFSALNQDIILFNEVAFTKTLVARKFALFHEPSGKYYHYQENNSLEIGINIFTTLVLLFFYSLRFCLHSIIYEIVGKNRFAVKGFGLEKN